MHWILVGASLFASNIGSGHFIGLAGTGAASGIGISGFELSAIFYLMFLGWCFVPVYMASGVYTMPEYLRLRFGGQRIRVYLSVLALLLYVFTKISADLYAGALFITKSTGFEGDGPIYLSILLLLAIACLFTVAGGLTAVIWTDFIQTVLMIIGAVVLAILAFLHEDIAGYENLIDKYFLATATVRATTTPNGSELCGEVPGDAMHLLRDATPGASDLPWSGMIFGLAISSIWYWCSDQVIVQRALASKDMSHAKGACILAGYLKLLPLFIMIFPGMAARVLFADEVACADPDRCEQICGNKSGCTNIAFVKLVTELMPPGLRGMMLAVMLAALMSSLTSVFNSSSTIFTMDIYPRLRSKPSEVELLVVGRIFVLVLVTISVIWIPIIRAMSSQLFDYIQAITSFLAPPVCAVYLLAIFWKRTNEPGAFWGLMVGLVVGLIRFILEYSFSKPACGDFESKQPPDWWFKLVDDIHYLHFGLLLWFITGIVTVGVSLMTTPPPEDSLHRLTWWTRHSTKVRTPLEEEISTGEEAIKPKPIKSELPKYKILLNWICGIEMSDGSAPAISNDSKVMKKTPEEDAIDAVNLLSEPETKKSLVDANAVLVMSLAMFFWGFYA